MKYDKLLIVSAVCLVAITVSVFAGSVYAFRGNWHNKDFKFSEEKLEHMKSVKGEDFDWSSFKSKEGWSGHADCPYKEGMEKKMAYYGKHEALDQEAINEALANNDYDTWLVAVGEDSMMAQKITEENFSKYVEMINLKKELWQ